MLVTRDYGREVLAEQAGYRLTESSSALRMLDETVDIETRYGGGFVQSVDGLSGGTEGGRRSDWFYSVNGVVADRGAAEYRVDGGDLVWWDYRDWTDATEIGAVVGAFPAPMTDGYDGKAWPVRVDCSMAAAACGKVKSKLRAAGVVLTPGPAPSGSNAAEGRAGSQTWPEVMRIMVGPWHEIGGTPEGRRLNRGPAVSGVFARFEPAETPVPARGSSGGGAASGPAVQRLTGLDRQAEPVSDYGPGAGLVAAMRQGERPPVWLVTGGSAAAVGRAADL
ncbi:MAG: DUF4430 domain-containing protein, partial [Acidobacteriota bacterium]